MAEKLLFEAGLHDDGDAEQDLRALLVCADADDEGVGKVSQRSACIFVACFALPDLAGPSNGLQLLCKEMHIDPATVQDAERLEGVKMLGNLQAGDRVEEAEVYI